MIQYIGIAATILLAIISITSHYYLRKHRSKLILIITPTLVTLLTATYPITLIIQCENIDYATFAITSIIVWFCVWAGIKITL